MRKTATETQVPATDPRGITGPGGSMVYRPEFMTNALQASDRRTRPSTN